MNEMNTKNILRIAFVATIALCGCTFKTFDFTGHYAMSARAHKSWLGYSFNFIRIGSVTSPLEYAKLSYRLSAANGSVLISTNMTLEDIKKACPYKSAEARFYLNDDDPKDANVYVGDNCAFITRDDHIIALILHSGTAIWGKTRITTLDGEHAFSMPATRKEIERVFGPIKLVAERT